CFFFFIFSISSVFVTVVFVGSFSFVEYTTRMGPLIIGMMMAYLYYYHSDRVRTLLQRYAVWWSALALVSMWVIWKVTSVSSFNPNLPHDPVQHMHYLAWYRNLFSLSLVKLAAVVTHLVPRCPVGLLDVFIPYTILGGCILCDTGWKTGADRAISKHSDDGGRTRCAI
ncbi:MAG: hypothetical protein HUJ30_08370, partial [Gammaproteobacteria bacterium]|nr:hypothetical protein [Gammaproteobacteria bacterium]